MKVAIHSMALKEIFEGSCDPVTSSAVLASKISMTLSVLTQYEALLGSDLKYQAWFASLSSANRFSFHMPQHAPPSVQAEEGPSGGYAAASYFGASILVAEQVHLGGPAVAAVAKIGVKLLSARSALTGTHSGDNPFFTIALKATGSEDFDVLDRFLIPEQRVVIYDKYINNISIDLIEHIAKKLPPTAVLEIFHSVHAGNNRLSNADVEARVHAANAAITTTCKTCPTSFTSTQHDRYIFLGNRIQMVFTVGLDCFGPLSGSSGRRVNRLSKIMFFDVTAGEALDIEASDGTYCRVKHISALPA